MWTLPVQLRPACWAVRSIALASGLLLCGLGDRPVLAYDWPQILGPSRNGLLPEAEIDPSLVTENLKPLWDYPCGSGVAGVAIQQGTVVLYHRPKKEVAEGVDLLTGKSKWKTEFPSSFRASILNDDGPRCVPTIDGTQVFLFSPQGVLRALELATGKVQWTRETHADFGAGEGYFGAGSSPLVVGSLVVVNVGGVKQGAGVVAFDRKTGKTKWKATSEDASYAAPLLAVIEGQPVVVCLARLNCIGLDPETGRELWRHPFGQRGPTVNGATPVLSEAGIFLTASYGIGSTLLKISQNKVTPSYQGDEFLASQYATPMARQGVMYAVNGRQDGSDRSLLRFEPQSRKISWSEPLSEYATLISTKNHLLVVQTDGKLQVVQANPNRFSQVGSAQLTTGTTRALPALSNGVLIVRDNSQFHAFRLDTPNSIR